MVVSYGVRLHDHSTWRQITPNMSIYIYIYIYTFIKPWFRGHPYDLRQSSGNIFGIWEHD